MKKLKNFVAKIIHENWFQTVTSESPKQWTFDQKIRELQPKQLGFLLKLVDTCLSIKTMDSKYYEDLVQNFRKNKSVNIHGYNISHDFLIKFLHTITLTEHYFDQVSQYPQNLAHKILRDYSDEIGLPFEIFSKIFVGWEERGKLLVYKA